MLTQLFGRQVFSGLTARDIQDNLKRKSKWFRDFEEVARKQAAAYESAASELGDFMSGDNAPAKAAPKIKVPTTKIEDALGELIPKSTTFSREEWKARESALLSHVHCIAERYRQELSCLHVYVSRALKAFDRLNSDAAVLLYNLEKTKIPLKTIETWTLLHKNQGTQLCKCETCFGRSSSKRDPVNRDLPEEAKIIADARCALSKGILYLRETSGEVNAELRERMYSEWDMYTGPLPATYNAVESTGNLDELLEEWNTYFAEREAKIWADYQEQKNKLSERRAEVEWEMRSCIASDDENRSEAQRLQEYIAEWHEMKLQATVNQKAAWEIYDNHPFPKNLQVVTAEELKGKPQEEREGCVTALERNASTLLKKLDEEHDVLSKRVAANHQAMSLDLNDEEFLEFVNVSIEERPAWLDARLQKIKNLPPLQKLQYETNAAIKQSLKTTTAELNISQDWNALCKDLPSDISNSENVNPLYRGTKDQPPKFDFMSAEAWQRELVEESWKSTR